MTEPLKDSTPPVFPKFDVPAGTPPLTPEMVRRANEGE
jgi:hypothetical protein